jgi:hypothetical protein
MGAIALLSLTISIGEASAAHWSGGEKHLLKKMGPRIRMREKRRFRSCHSHVSVTCSLCCRRTGHANHEKLLVRFIL